MEEKLVYLFQQCAVECGSFDSALLGGKGANLAAMCALDLPVPPGFTVVTSACREYYQTGRRLPNKVEDQVLCSLRSLESILGRFFGRVSADALPLLVSVRSGSPVSMPGMMDTILNLGLNDEVTERLATYSGDRFFAFDSYRRFIQMYSEVVLKIPHAGFEEILLKHSLSPGGHAHAVDTICAEFKEYVLSFSGIPFPQDVYLQLFSAISAVFDSWRNDRALVYREMNGISHDLGTAVNIQAMVFGNLSQDSCTGVVFTRSPVDGTNTLFGEYLSCAQGEDVVAGLRTPLPLSRGGAQSDQSLEFCYPEIYSELFAIAKRLESHFASMQDIEFTVENGKLWILQTRKGQCTGQAILRIACDMVEEGVLTKERAVMSIKSSQIVQLLHSRIDPDAEKTLLAVGLPASPGAVCGKIVFSAAEAVVRSADGESVILVRYETSPDDIRGMVAARGILTACGGMTSHAAVVARGMGRACVVGASSIIFSEDRESITVGDYVLHAGDSITLDGTEGEIYLGEVKTFNPGLSSYFETVMGWCDSMRSLKVFANAETVEDLDVALRFGIEGVGLCRTEHMFFVPERLRYFRLLILSETDQERKIALEAIHDMQVNDFYNLFMKIGSLPFIIRLLDPPLHEFLQLNHAEILDISNELGVSEQEVKVRIARLEEVNPMLGHRGCRLGVSHFEIYAMQVRAILEAQQRVSAGSDISLTAKIMLPLISDEAELVYLCDGIRHLVTTLEAETSCSFLYELGIMIEVPRAALIADHLAKHVSFFSFGTNDLTQTTYALSRDDSADLLQQYRRAGIFDKDPFMTLDTVGVGALCRLALNSGRRVSPGLSVGVCGEHAGDSDSVVFFRSIGVDYVSCSPYRIPVAKLAAAQAEVIFSHKIS